MNETPVDRTQRCTTDGKPFDPTTDDNGQQANYVILCDEERAKGFVRPVRDAYKHLTCGTVTTMGRTLAETWARDNTFYSHTYCCQCGTHSPVEEFVWEGTNERLGS